MKFLTLALLTSTAMAMAIPVEESDELVHTSNPFSGKPTPPIHRTYDEYKKHWKAVEEASARIYTAKNELDTAYMGLTYSKYLDVSTMYRLKSDLQKIREKVSQMGNEEEVKKLAEDSEKESRGFDAVINEAEKMCASNENKYDFCVLFSADMYTKQARELRGLFYELLLKLDDKPGQELEIDPSTVNTYKEVTQKFEIFKLLDTSRWTSGNKERASADLEAITETYDMVTNILKEAKML